eukprot:3757987-Prymnesium_polylepis.1
MRRSCGRRANGVSASCAFALWTVCGLHPAPWDGAYAARCKAASLLRLGKSFVGMWKCKARGNPCRFRRPCVPGSALLGP